MKPNEISDMTMLVSLILNEIRHGLGGESRDPSSRPLKFKKGRSPEAPAFLEFEGHCQSRPREIGGTKGSVQAVL